MNELEKKYYEDVAFWEGEMLQDPRNMERFRSTADLIPPDTKSILDAGCGNGVFVNFLSDLRPELNIHALDRSETALSYVKTNRTLGDISDLPFEDDTFDCVSCLEVIEHLPITTFERTLTELARVARKYVLISVPYKEKLEDSYTTCPLCKTVFNYELHLRSFDDEYFSHLLDNRGFRCTSTFKAGKAEYLKFHKLYRKLFYREQFKVWKSPICPLCGYKEENSESKAITNNSNEQHPQSRKFISYFTYLPKLIWPKETKYYWVIGLFEKIR